MVKFQIRLDDASFRVLRVLAEREYREPRHQAALLIRESLERRGLLAETATPLNTQQPAHLDGTNLMSRPV